MASVKNFTEKHSVVGKLASGPWSLGIFRNDVTKFISGLNEEV